MFRKSLVLGIMMLFVVTGIIPNTVRDVSASDDGLVGYWSFDEGSGSTVYDSSANNNHGTIYGATWTTGISGSALSFDGWDDYVDCGTDSSLDLTNVGTVEAWAYLDSYDSHYRYHPNIAGKGANAGWDCPGYTLWVRYDNPQGVYGHISAASGGSDFIGISYGKPSTGVWHHYVFTWDGNYLRAYIDGEQYGDPVEQTSISNSAGKKFLMATSSFRDNYYHGFIDEVRVYNRALTASEILDHYNNPSGGVSTPTADAGNDVAAYVGESVSFVGTATDDGIIELYEWDFDGDGTYDYSSTTTGSTTHTYHRADINVATLRITDDDGLTDTDTKAVEINGRGFWFDNCWGNKDYCPFNWDDCNKFWFSQVQQKLLNDPVWQRIFALYPPLEPILTLWVYLKLEDLHKEGHCLGMSTLVTRYHNFPEELSTNTIYDLRVDDIDNTGESVYERIDYYQQSQIIDCYTFATTRLLILDLLNNKDQLDTILNYGFPCIVVLSGEKIVDGKTEKSSHAVVPYDYNESSKTLFIYDPNHPDYEKSIEFSISGDSCTFDYPFWYETGEGNLKKGYYTSLCIIGYSDETILQLFLDLLKDSLFVRASCPVELTVYDPNGNEVGESLSDGENHLVIVSNVINGSYKVELKGTGTGEYNISMLRFLNNVTVYENISDVIDKDQVTQYTTFINESISVIDVVHHFPSTDNGGAPGFELILALVVIAIVLLWKRYKKK